MLKKANFIRTLILLFTVLLCFSGCERLKMPIDPDLDAGIREHQPLTVMTYNVYLGSSVERVLSVDNILGVPAAVAEVYESFQASDFPGRAKAIAASIKAYQPHLIGLQEMSLIRIQHEGDRIAGGTVPAEEVVIDFRAVLLDALTAEGLNYRIAAEVANIDVEMPMFTDDGIADIRLTDYDVIFARSDVETSDATSAIYKDLFAVPTLGLDIERGYVAVDATVNGTAYRFVNTHLEVLSSDIRLAQTQELIDSLREETLPIVMVGDFNTPAPDGAAYQLLLSEMYVDAYAMAADAPVNTCCQDGDLRNPESAHVTRIDLIFTRNLADVPYTATVNTLGDTPSERLASGMWSSDHAGVVAELVFE